MANNNNNNVDRGTPKKNHVLHTENMACQRIFRDVSPLRFNIVISELSTDFQAKCENMKLK